MTSFKIHLSMFVSVFFVIESIAQYVEKYNFCVEIPHNRYENIMKTTTSLSFPSNLKKNDYEEYDGIAEEEYEPPELETFNHQPSTIGYQLYDCIEICSNAKLYTMHTNCWKMIYNNSVIPIIHTNIHTQVSYVNELELAQLGIEEIEVGAFTNAPNLTTINLANNKLKKIIRGTFSSLANLWSLNVSHNDISIIEEQSFHGSIHIEVLDFSYNKISYIPENVFQHSHLTFLDLSNNMLASMESDFCKYIPFFNRLFLNNNFLITVPSCLTKLSVFHLSLSFNYITVLNGTSLPDSLEEFFISNNNLSHINKDTFVKMERIHSLDISYNNLEKIQPDCFEHLKFIKYLDISGINLKTIHPKLFSSMKYLDELRMRNNNITFLPKGTFQYIPHLTKLDLSQNNLEYLQFGFFKSLENLQWLNISHNNIEYIQTGLLSGLTSLVYLDLSWNSLKTISLHIFNTFRKIERIDLKFNQLESLDVEHFSNKGHSFGIELDGNNLTCTHLADFHLRTYQVILVKGNTYSSENIEGVSCSDQEKSEEKLSEDQSLAELKAFFQNDFKNSSFYHFFRNFPIRMNRNNSSKDMSRIVENLYRNLTSNFTDNINVYIKEFMNFENNSFQNFLKQLEILITRLDDKKKYNESKTLENLTSSLSEEMKSFVLFENSSFQNFIDKLSDIVDNIAENSNKSRNIPEIAYELHKLNSDKLVSSEDPYKSIELIGALKNFKLLMFLCFILLLLNFLLRIFPYVKQGYVRAEHDEQSHEMPILES